MLTTKPIVSNSFVLCGLCVLCSLCVLGSVLSAQRGAQNGDWRFYGGDAGSTKYSPLDHINAANVKDLRIAWRWKADNFGADPEYNLQATPLAVNGILYTTAGTRRSVVAIDGATGETLWMFRFDEGDRGRAAPRRNHRGVSYWTDGRGDERILYITPGYQLIALNAKTGDPIPAFGKDGIVDLFDELDTTRPRDGQIGASSPPMIVRNVAIVGGALPASTGRDRRNVPGHVRGYDVRTGKRVWTFHTIPRPGEFGNETWQNDSWSFTGNTAVWAPMSADEELGYVYLPVETPTNDTYGGHRPGDNLFAESLVCLDATTGKRIWHFQFVHHGIWDYDTPAPPILLDLTVNGKPIKAVAQVTKQAFTYVFDRVTGQPVWPIEERPVPQSDVPGEQTAATQPFPTKPPPFDRQGVSENDLIDFTPELKAEALKMASEYKLGPLFTPPIVAGTDGKRGTLMLPNMTGGANWQGGAADPETGMLYVASGTSVIQMTLNPDNVGVEPKPLPRPDAWCGASGRKRRRRGAGRRPGRRTRRATAGAAHVRSAGAADDQAAVRPHRRHEPEHRRSRVDGRQRRGAGLDQEPSGAEGRAAAADRPLRARRPDGHEDAAVRRRRIGPVRGPAGLRRPDVPRARQEDRRHRLRVQAAREPERHPDDLPRRRQAVHRRRGRRRRARPASSSL